VTVPAVAAVTSCAWDAREVSGDTDPGLPPDCTMPSGGQVPAGSAAPAPAGPRLPTG